MDSSQSDHYTTLPYTQYCLATRGKLQNKLILAQCTS